MLRPKKVGALPVEGSDEEKRTNEIRMAIPILQTCQISGMDITGDALLTQRAIATYIVQQHAHYHFTVKGNQPTLESDIALIFKDRSDADYTEVSPPEHGRIETRRIWCSAELNGYLDFPYVGQVFLIERESVDKKSGKLRSEVALGVTSSSAGFTPPCFADQPGTLEHRKRSLHHRLELRRGPKPYSNRLRSREHDSPPPFRCRHLEVFPETPSVARDDDAHSCL